MGRNDLIIALIRVLGVYIVVEGLRKLFDFLDFAIGRTYDFAVLAYDTSFKLAWAGYPLGRLVAAFLLALFLLLLGMYLMKSGNWFAKKATQD